MIRNSMVSKAQFLICNSCFWCASILTSYFRLRKCPRCSGEALESMSLALDETYKFNYSTKNGVTLEFA
jgi:hypothetical protein